jgi:hypothetical protein
MGRFQILGIIIILGIYSTTWATDTNCPLHNDKSLELPYNYG